MRWIIILGTLIGAAGAGLNLLDAKKMGGINAAGSQPQTVAFAVMAITIRAIGR